VDFHRWGGDGANDDQGDLGARGRRRRQGLQEARSSSPSPFPSPSPSLSPSSLLGMMPICLHPKQPPRPFSLPHIHSTYLSLSPPRDYCARTESLVTDRVFGHGQSLWSYMCRIVATMSKETYYSGKRDLLECQMRPSTVSNETYYSVETELLHGQSLWSYVSESSHASISFSLSHTCICLSLSRMHAHVCRSLSLSYMQLSARHTSSCLVRLL